MDNRLACWKTSVQSFPNSSHSQYLTQKYAKNLKHQASCWALSVLSAVIFVAHLQLLAVTSRYHSFGSEWSMESQFVILSENVYYIISGYQRLSLIPSIWDDDGEEI